MFERVGIPLYYRLEQTAKQIIEVIASRASIGKGAQAEIEKANRLGMPVYYSLTGLPIELENKSK